MVEPSRHCPYLGLKQNRAIRFASPTSEHRCYVTGEAQEIPVDQTYYCLTQDHVNCPLYMGLSMSSTATAARLAPTLPQETGVRGWLTILSPRDRIIYGVLLSVMLLIIGIYMVLAVRLLFAHDSTISNPPASPTGTPATAQIDIVQHLTPPTATVLPVPPTRTPPVAVAPPGTATNPTPRTGAIATVPPAVVPASPTSVPTNAVVEQGQLLLYFADPSQAMLVATTRRAPVPGRQLAEATLRELLAGPEPGSGLRSALAAGVRLLNIELRGDLLTVNLDRSPGNAQAVQALVLTLTEPPHFRAIGRVQLQVNGTNSGLDGDTGPISRPILNPDNPQALPTSYNSGTRFLPLYFMQDAYRIRITRLVPRTDAVAQATVEELLDGPGGYSNLLITPIPAGVQLRSIQRQGSRVIVDLTAPFATAPDRRAALDTLLLSLTELRDSTGQSAFQQVEVLIDGRKLEEFWGAGYAGPFQRPALNPE